MSYSFVVKAVNKSTAKQKVTEEMNKIIAQQPCHKEDGPIAVTAAHAQIDVLPQVEGKDLSVSMYGSVSGSWDNGTFVQINSIQANQTVSWVGRDS